MDSHLQQLLHRFSTDLENRTGLVLAESRRAPANEGQINRPQVDALLTLRLIDGEEIQIAIEALRSAYPRDVRMAAYKLSAQQQNAEGPLVVPCVIAERLSPGSRDALREAGINYFDASGTLYFHFRTWLVDVERLPAKPGSRKPSTLFSSAREQVIHALLHHWLASGREGFISGTELAALAQTSTYTVSQTMRELEREDLVETTGSGPSLRRRLRNAPGLLDAWASAWPLRRDTITRWHVYTPSDNLVDLLTGPLTQHPGWVVTGAAAANIAAPHLTHIDRIEVIVPEGQTEVFANALHLTPADKGANVILIERSGASMMFRHALPEYPGSCFASPFVQYLDLLNGYGRNKELARVFRHQVLKMEQSP
ncbi:MAG: hypothetical protein JO171_13240 [Paludibacterium sp.]|uniref:type IV toxin-antitoxin system AbiEi family antitoxin n=1 Tax=Paludibacterium sp. TaxID=1917523 RepID=UPI0025EB295E|nr:type IV toxin-antitoxin system AbiEi family antitoxin [Paludibacterium sp.]MBV8048118.1 hypothetical protein [Paludibacterium sp.]MBV8647010.1 hypothetical protein [Paludibacterium sp.]